MTAVRDALDTYPLGHLLRPGLGRMDLRPSLTLHLERELDAPPPPPADPAIDELVERLLLLRREWITQVQQVSAAMSGGMTERTAVLTECVNALTAVLEGDG